jgi:hypothetical protein
MSGHAASVIPDVGEYALHVATGKRVYFNHVRTAQGVMTFRAERPLSALECTLIESTVGPLCIINRRDVYTSEVKL